MRGGPPEGTRVPAAATRGAPPGPAGYPIVGVFPMARRDPLGFFTDCVRRHGDLVAMRLGPHHVYLLRHPDHVKHVLQDNARAYAKAPTASRVRSLFGESLTMVDGDRWRERRRHVQPAFQPGLHARFASVVARAVAELLERWRPLAERGEPTELTGEMRRLTQTIIIRACFGEVSAGELQTLCQALDAAVTRVDRRLWSPLGWLDVPSPASARYRRALGEVDAFISRLTAEARRSGPPPGTMLAALLDATEPLTTPELHDELKAFLFAGHTTTASALAWVWHVLSEHPEARELIEEECLAVLGGRNPGMEDLPSLRDTRRVIEEVLRLYPPTWLTARSPVEDDSLGGYVIPAGALVLLSPYLTHRHPAIWDDPERFDPDRFILARAAMRPAFAYFPFGGGPRRCIGSAFATTEMQMIVATVAQRYRLSLLPGAPVFPTAGLTLRPGSALPARILGR
jgi:cytochrome P450